MSSVSSSSFFTSSDDEEEDVEFLVDEHEVVRQVKGCGGGQQQLPWHENYWSIKITHVVSPNEVWATLSKNAVGRILIRWWKIDVRNSSVYLCCFVLTFQGLLAQAERMVSILTLKLAKRIVIGGTYIVKRKHLLHRVTAIKSAAIGLNERRGFFIDCFFIDIGRIEAIAHDELYDCVDAFSAIPPQAICLKLFGFDELSYCPRVERYFSAWLMNKQLYACLMMGEEQYQIQLKHGIRMPKITVTPFAFYPKFALYKPILLKQIGESLPKPAFPQRSNGDSDTIINAKVSHVSAMGRVYFQLDEQSINYIGTLIQQFVSERQQLTHRFHVSETMTNCVVLIYDIERHIYHRAKIIAVESGSSSSLSSSSTKYKCFCIDTGATRSVEVSNIFGLNENSMLCYYPGQAVPAVLHSITAIQHTTFERLNAILTNCAEVQVNVMGQKGALPFVTVYKQSMNINALVRMEFELNK